MCDLKHIKIEIVIGEDRAAYRRDAYDFGADFQLIDRFCDKTVDQAVTTARTVPERRCFKAFRPAKYFFYRLAPS